MELKIINKENQAIGKKKMPEQFSEEVREDLIKRAVLAIQRNKRQSYGASYGAGMRQSAKLSRRRRDYKGSYGLGISRVPRKILSGKGTRWNWVGAVAPGTVGGRRAHPAKPFKIWEVKLNKKERRKAIRSALSATMKKELVIARGHKIPDNYPFLMSDEIENISKTKELIQTLTILGFGAELERTTEKKIRAGKGKSRNRKYIRKKCILIIVSGKCNLQKAARNIPGIDVVQVEKVNAELLAPGTKPGRATLFSQKAIELLEKNKIFTG